MKQCSIQFTEKDTAIIRDIKPEIFQKLIDIIYMQPIQILSVEEAVELCNVAEMYNIEDLKNISGNFMIENCTYDNCFYLHEQASMFCLINVISKCQDLFRKNVSENMKLLDVLTIKLDDINEDTFVEFLAYNESPASILYQLLEFLVFTGKLKTWKYAVRFIQFQTMSIEEVILAELLSESDKLAIIANIEAMKERKLSILDLPDHLVVITGRPEIDHSFHYKYFWILMLLRSPTQSFEAVLKRASVIKNLFTKLQIQIISELFRKKLNVEEMEETNEYYVVRRILQSSEFLKWFDIIYHDMNICGKKQVTIFGKDMCHQSVSLEFLLDE